MTAADICRERGWEPKQLVLARYMTDWGGWEELVGRITAIGESSVLVVPLGGRTSKFPKWYVATAAESIVDQFGEVTALDRLPWEVPDACPRCHANNPVITFHGMCQNCLDRKASETAKGGAL